ncbi:unnamed protein product [Cyprideis torosa]|uniref:Uncharacterized protein n=1 Tax=Cyprideis torosa TaxID=163714 RepID=A0A7R8ZK58_9CRUS|nr:unnamed protein product [Cyprideis torosa]CAG0881061.1 unnamed protein product [Cyprideis torosa]
MCLLTLALDLRYFFGTELLRLPLSYNGYVSIQSPMDQINVAKSPALISTDPSRPEVFHESKSHLAFSSSWEFEMMVFYESDDLPKHQIPNRLGWKLEFPHLGVSL